MSIALALVAGLVVGTALGRVGPAPATAQTPPPPQPGCAPQQTVDPDLMNALRSWNQELGALINAYHQGEIDQATLIRRLRGLEDRKFGMMRAFFPDLFGIDFHKVYLSLENMDTGLRDALREHLEGDTDGAEEDLRRAKRYKEFLEEDLLASGCQQTSDSPRVSQVGATSDGTTTRYAVAVEDPDGDELAFRWSKSGDRDCGSFEFDGNQAFWDHPHPPCPDEAVHPGVISVEVSDPRWVCRADYEGGSAPGTGGAVGTCALAELEPPPPLCFFRVPTVIGTRSSETIRGTPGRDVIDGRGGNDRIVGLGGDDLLCGGSGDDVIESGPGRDRLSGSFGNDRLDGGSDRDVLFGGVGRDRLLGGGGSDGCHGGPGRRDLILIGGNNACERYS